MDRTDSEIVSLSIMDEPTAFVDLAWRHATAIHGYLCRRAGRQNADDLLGEVFVQAFRSRAGYQHRSADARPWLYGIARHVLQAYWRTSLRPQAPLEVAASDPWPDVDDQLDAESHRTELERALEFLSHDEREILLLFTWERLTQSEIALELGIPQGTVRSRLHRARAIMREHVAVPSPVVGSRQVKEE